MFGAGLGNAAVHTIIVRDDRRDQHPSVAGAREALIWAVDTMIQVRRIARPDEFRHSEGNAWPISSDSPTWLGDRRASMGTKDSSNSTRPGRCTVWRSMLSIASLHIDPDGRRIVLMG